MALDDTPGCAHAATLDFHRLMAQSMPAEDSEDWHDARRGFIGTVADAQVNRPKGPPAWNLEAYGFLDDEQAADTVHPSLWRQARLNRVHGLFEVTPRIFQVRGFDIANITFIEGDTGVIALDALTCPETAAAALALYREHRGPRTVHTVIYSHSHGDHFGGVHGLVSEADVKAGRVQVIAPSGFLYHATAENVIAGVAMARRAQFQFGHTLDKGPRGQVDAGLGKTLPLGRPGLIAPTWTIEAAHERHVIDGVEIHFQLTPETEAPSEMHFYFPGERALNLAENATHNLHNLCPLRGAKVRDSLAWAKYLHQALVRWGDGADVVFAQHHWPTWGAARVQRFIAEQRDLYRVLHDQTVRLMSHGLKAAEIAERLQLPEALAQRWHTRGYYGTVSHNVKAIVQHYLSWYDAHPANLNALPPVEAARKHVDYMGGLDALMARAAADFERGEFRWVAEVMKHAVYAHPDHPPARDLAARALEQMGYQAESATWRNAYLLAAREYRSGPPPATVMMAGNMLLGALSNELLFDALAVRVNAPRAQAQRFSIGWHFTCSGAHWLSTLSHGALSSLAVDDLAASDVQVACTRATLDEVLMQTLPMPQALAEGRIVLSGQAALLGTLFDLLDRFSGTFPVVDAAPWPDR
ncbi:alkyl/aryl-sulfatase [Ideonella sp. A 288]|uniref:alkyl/aryl-sulfatase n=1 Tax=Ideonella sp. A 288 TaxID=1962181 RepID=UPI000B4AA4CF|nr:alkyl sulfatase dimerization domain-containing protein [Ideonella sp. A 288]